MIKDHTLDQAIIEATRCHLTPMKLAGYHKHRHWKCQHCSHTKPLEVNDG